jgi:hypothetical protein
LQDFWIRVNISDKAAEKGFDIMGYSDPENKPWAIEKIKEINPKTVLDCGAGAGTYLDLIKSNMGNSVIVLGVEAWYPSIIKYSLEERYDFIYPVDVRTITDFKFDLVILGDILEHMSIEDATTLWSKIAKDATYALISIPIIHYPQGAVDRMWITSFPVENFSISVIFSSCPVENSGFIHILSTWFCTGFVELSTDLL